MPTMLEKLHTNPPSPLVRVLLLGQVAAFIIAAMAYMWWVVDPRGTVRACDVVFYVIMCAWPIAMNLLDGDRPRDSGIRLDNIGASAGEVGLATLLAGASVAGVGAAVGGIHWLGWAFFARKAGEYAAFALAQQYLLQTFVLRRFRQAGLPASHACVLAACLFAMLHAPNWPLVALTAGMGVVWCALFLRRPNLLTLALSHVALSLTAYYALPVSWLGNLTVGPMYLRWMGR